MKGFDILDNASDIKSSLVPADETWRSEREQLNLALDHLQLQLGDRLCGIEALGTGFGAVHDGVAAVQPERIFQIVEPFAGGLVAAVLDPPGRLQQCGRAEKAFAVPPIARA